MRAWATHAADPTGTNALRHKLEKMAEARVFLRKLERYDAVFASARSVLELGGGSCWASYLVKRLYRHARVVGTDIAPAAVAHHPVWEAVFDARIDGAAVCRSYETPFPDASFDVVFCFEAAHHFGRHRQTLREIGRLLRPGGTALYLHEPGCRRYVHALAHRRVNRKRPEVPEDVLVYHRLAALAEEAGLDAAVSFDPSLVNRGPGASVYYAVLRVVPVLQDVLPCTVDVVMSKPAAR